MNIAEQVDWYREVRPTYEKATEQYIGLLQAILERSKLHAFIEGRVKTIKSFEEKCLRPGKSYSNPSEEITDLAGVRLVLPSLIEVEEAEELIYAEFFVDTDRSVNKRLTISVTEFGYLSTHLIVKVHDKRKDLPEWSGVKNVWVEIQIRTALEHAWAVASHEVDYKEEVGIPSELKRTLIQLSGMLENVDKQISGLLNQARTLRSAYKEQVIAETLNIEINIDSLTAYLNNSDIVREWIKFIEGLGVKVDSSDATSRAVALALFVDMHTVADVDNLVRQSWPWTQNVLTEYMEPGSYMNRGGILDYLLVANFPDRFTPADMNLNWGWGAAERILNPAMKYNPKYQRIS